MQHACCMHDGPVLTLTFMSNLGRVILAQNMLDSAYHAYLGLGQPSALDMHVSKCPQPPTSGICVHACPRSQPRQACKASTCGLNASVVHGPPRFGFT
eukprot:326675-Chlamydomonas_euryale.AAC.3